MAVTREEKMWEAMLNDAPERIPTAVTRKERMLQKLAKQTCDNDTFSGGGSGGVSSWNDLTDKPFEAKSGNITWDGNTEGLPNAGKYYLVSDRTPSKTELIECGADVKAESIDGEISYSVTDPLWQNWWVEFDGGYRFNAYFAVALSDNVQMDDGVILPAKGIYFRFTNPVSYTTGLVWNGIKRLGEEYLPNTSARDNGVPFFIVYINTNGTINSFGGATYTVNNCTLKELHDYLSGGVGAVFAVVTDGFNSCVAQSVYVSSYRSAQFYFVYQVYSVNSKDEVSYINKKFMLDWTADGITFVDLDGVEETA